MLRIPDRYFFIGYYEDTLDKVEVMLTVKKPYLFPLRQWFTYMTPSRGYEKIIFETSDQEVREPRYQVDFCVLKSHLKDTIEKLEAHGCVNESVHGLVKKSKSEDMYP